MNKYVKEGLIRGFLGIPVAVFIGQLIFLLMGTGVYLPFMDKSWLAQLGVLSFLGCYCGVAGVVYTVESWSKGKQIGVYTVVIVVLFMAIQMMKNNIWGS